MAQPLYTLIAGEDIEPDAGPLLRQRLGEALQDVVGALPAGALYEAAREDLVPGTGLDVRDRRVLGVRVDKFVALEIPAVEKARFVEGRYPARTAYAYYREKGKLYVAKKGQSTTVERDDAYCHFVETPPDVEESAVYVGDFPYAMTRLVALRYALRKKLSDIQAERENLPAYSVLTEGALPGPPSAPSFSYANASAGSITPTTLTAPSDPSEPSAPSEPTAPGEPTAPTAPSSAQTIDLSGLTKPDYEKGSLALPDGAGSDWETYEGDEERLQEELDYFDKLTAEFLAQIRDELNDVETDLKTWQTEVEEKFREAELAHRFDQEGYGTGSAQYGREASYQVESYAAQARFQVDAYAQQFTARVGAYRAQVEEAIAQARVTLEEQVESARQTTEVNLRNAAESLRQGIEDYAAQLRRHEQQMREYLGQVQRQAAVVEGQTNLFVTTVRNLRYELGDLARRYQEAFDRYVRTRSAPPRLMRLHRV